MQLRILSILALAFACIGTGSAYVPGFKPHLQETAQESLTASELYASATANNGSTLDDILEELNTRYMVNMKVPQSRSA